MNMIIFIRSLALLLIIFAGFIKAEIVFSQEPSLEQKITLNLTNAGLEEILEEISNKSDIDFSYDSGTVSSKKRISLKYNNEELKTILDKISVEYNLEYSIVKRQIVIKKGSARSSKPSLYTISGYVREKETGENLPGATIMVSQTTIGTISNAYGFYSLSLPAGDYEILYSFVGFEKHYEKVNLNKNIQKNIELDFNISSLTEITIIMDEQLENLQKSQSSLISVNPRSLERIPEFGGESGLIKGLQTLPGIQTHSDGSSFFFVRGGNKDQNLILVDEAPIYNPAHLFGLYSFVIPDVAKSINIYKSDLPIDKSNRLSSLIEVQTRDGNMKKFDVEGLLNPLMYRISLEGPILREKASFFTSYRHSNFKWLYNQSAPNADLYFMDFNTKLNWKISDKNRLYFAVFYGKDNYTDAADVATTGLIWKNTTSTLRWNHLYSNRLFSNATIYLSNYDYKLLTGFYPWESGISNISFKYDFSYFPNPDKTILFGIAHTEHEINPGNLNVPTEEDSPYIPKVSSSKSSLSYLYYSREKNISKKWSWKAGARLPLWLNKGQSTIYTFDEDYNVSDTLFYGDDDISKKYLNLDIRLSTKYSLTDFSAIKSSFGIYHQHLHLLSNSISPLSSFEIWMPSGKNIKPQRAAQFTFGYNWLYPELSLEFTSEMYYKKMYNQIEYENHAHLLLNPLVEGELRFGQSKSYGIELSVKKTKGKLSGWMSYTYSRVFNVFRDINNNEQYPAFYDRPHDFSIFLSYLITSRLSTSATWVYYSGSAITTPVGFYYYNDNLVPVYGDRNNDRLPDYHRLDWSISYQLSKASWKYQHSISLGIYNLYNRHNPTSINFNKVETQDGHIVVPANLYGTHEILSTQKYMTGIMPSLTYKFKF